jgi:hypothetical protein
MSNGRAKILKFYYVDVHSACDVVAKLERDRISAKGLYGRSQLNLLSIKVLAQELGDPFSNVFVGDRPKQSTTLSALGHNLDRLSFKTISKCL